MKRAYARLSGLHRAVVIIVLIAVSVSLTGCYDAAGAVAYELHYVGTLGGDSTSGYYSYYVVPSNDDDCTDFVSQAWAGNNTAGVVQNNDVSSYNGGRVGWQDFPANPIVDNNWWGIPTNDSVDEDSEATATYVHTWGEVAEVDGRDDVGWINVQDFLNLFANDTQGADGKQALQYEGSYSYSSYPRVRAPAEPPGVSNGDLISYNLGGQSAAGIDHMTMVTNAGDDEDSNGYQGDQVSQHTVNLENTFWTLFDQSGDNTSITTFWWHVDPSLGGY